MFHLSTYLLDVKINLYRCQCQYTKYKYWSSTHFVKKYLSTSSAFISSTSTHIKICSKVRMDIQSKVNFGWTKYRAFPKSCLLKSRCPYSMQSRF